MPKELRLPTRGRPAGSDGYDHMHGEIVAVLETARRSATRSVNALMTASYWEIGRRIVESQQGGQDRAAYGEDLIKRLGADLSLRFGRGFGWRNLAQMRSFYLAWPSERILQTLSAKSSVSPVHHTESGEPPDLPALAQTFPLPWRRGDSGEATRRVRAELCHASSAHL